MWNKLPVSKINIIADSYFLCTVMPGFMKPMNHYSLYFYLYCKSMVFGFSFAHNALVLIAYRPIINTYAIYNFFN